MCIKNKNKPMKFGINCLNKKNIFLLFIFLFCIFNSNNYSIYGATVWQEPTCAPPNCNIEPPLNQGNTTQTKTGGLILQGGITVSSTSNLENVTIQGDKRLQLLTGAYIDIGTQFSSNPYPMINLNLSTEGYGSSPKGISISYGGGKTSGLGMLIQGTVGTSFEGIRIINPGGYGIHSSTSFDNIVALSDNGASVRGGSNTGIGLWGISYTIDGLAGRFDGEVLLNNDDLSSSTTIRGGGIKSTNLSGSGNRCLYADEYGEIKVSAGDCGLTNAESYSIPCNPAGVTTSPEKSIKIGESSYIYDSSCGGGPGTTLQIQSDETINIRGTAVSPQLFTVSQGSTNLFTILPDGNVGIGGVTSPLEKLQVNGAVYLGEIAAPSPTTTNRLYNTGGSLFWNGSQLNTSPIGWILSGTNLYTTSTVTKIGIGTTTPFSDLHVYNASDGPIITLSGLNTNYRGLTVKDTSGVEQWFYGSNSSNNFTVRRSGGTDYFTIASSTGYIGIGTQAPSSKLHVNGSTLITGNLNVQGSLTLATTTINSWEDIIQCPPRRVGIYFAGNPELNDHLFYNTCTRPNSHSIRLNNVNIIFDGGGGKRILYTDCQYFCREYGLPYGVNSNSHVCETAEKVGFYNSTGNNGNGIWEEFNCGSAGGTYTTSCDCSNGPL